MSLLNPFLGGSSKSSPSKKASSSNSTLDHTVIPFSIAIKRMSEILIYKANECKAKVGTHLNSKMFQFRSGVSSANV